MQNTTRNFYIKGITGLNWIGRGRVVKAKQGDTYIVLCLDSIIGRPHNGPIYWWQILPAGRLRIKLLCAHITGSGAKNFSRALRGKFPEMSRARARIFKLLRSPRIDSKDSIPTAYVAWGAGTTTLFLLGSLPPIECLKIPLQYL